MCEKVRKFINSTLSSVKENEVVNKEEQENIKELQKLEQLEEQDSKNKNE